MVADDDLIMDACTIDILFQVGCGGEGGGATRSHATPPLRPTQPAAACLPGPAQQPAPERPPSCAPRLGQAGGSRRSCPCPLPPSPLPACGYSPCAGTTCWRRSPPTAAATTATTRTGERRRQPGARRGTTRCRSSSCVCVAAPLLCVCMAASRRPGPWQQVQPNRPSQPGKAGRALHPRLRPPPGRAPRRVHWQLPGLELHYVNVVEVCECVGGRRAAGRQQGRAVCMRCRSSAASHGRGGAGGGRSVGGGVPAPHPCVCLCVCAWLWPAAAAGHRPRLPDALL